MIIQVQLNLLKSTTELFYSGTKANEPTQKPHLPKFEKMWLGRVCMASTSAIRNTYTDFQSDFATGFCFFNRLWGCFFPLRSKIKILICKFLFYQIFLLVDHE